jgi:branched-chain amino acid transport system ATP-binding protein
MGKTTTLRTLLGLIRPQQGTVRVHGKDMTGAPTIRWRWPGSPWFRRRRHFSKTDRLRESDDGRTTRPRRTRWLTFEHILELFRGSASGCAHGRDYRRRAADAGIGRALMTNPDLLILDEATEGLAPLIRQEIWATIRQLRSCGVAVLVVDKDIETLRTIADRCVIIAKGRIVYEGTPAMLAADHEVTLRHLGI